MASVAKFTQKSYSDMSLIELINLLTARLEAKEVANRTAVLAQPVMVVPVAEEKKLECLAELVQTVMQVPKAPIPSTSLFLAVPSVPLLRKKKATVAPLLSSTHLRPMACLKHCRMRRKCKVSRCPLWPITDHACGVKKGAATASCWFLRKLATSSLTSSNVKTSLPSPSNTVPSYPLTFHQCQEACWVAARVRADSSESFS
ncbi:hypothetical protein PR202_ga27666 [Eleusine coracana subsp. coracana]|uniref:Uncharacterized protein n=1 Tax=Eleusine coracana subsp. coracana TaxID=191504 RepID=A0AAV5DHF8_ELECO|nr:hypothetical protein PR202_ga27666 [Eleusine coracana subsp. coracana]